MQAVATYLTAITEQHRTGRAREHSYRPALSDLLRAIAPDDAVVTNEPSRERCGAPDFMKTQASLTHFNKNMHCLLMIEHSPLSQYYGL